MAGKSAHAGPRITGRGRSSQRCTWQALREDHRRFANLLEAYTAALRGLLGGL
jgi:hypothetical protein